MKNCFNKNSNHIQVHSQNFDYFLQNPIINWNDGIMLVKDRQHKFISSNNNFSKFSGLSPFELVGLSDDDMPWKDSSEIYVQHEEDIIAGNHYNVIEPLDGLIKTNLYTSKKIIYDKSGIPAGTIATAIFCNKKIDFQNINGISESLHVCGYRGYNLTKSESLILYYILKGYSRHKVAEKACITKHAYDFHFKNLKIKFVAKNKDDIIEICSTNGFHDIIPFNVLL